MKKIMIIALFALTIAGFGQSNWYDNLNEIRAIKTHVTGDDAGCLADSAMYQFSATDTNTDDGAVYLKPYNVAPASAGRWVKQFRIARASHTWLIRVESDTVEFGSAYDSNTLVFVIDTSLWFRLTHAVVDTQTMQMVYDSGWYASTMDTGAVVTPHDADTVYNLISAVHPYKSYVAILYQSSTNAPTDTVLFNDLGTVTYEYETLGFYNLKTDSLFTAHKTWVIISQGKDAEDYALISAYRADVATIEIKVNASAGAELEDDYLNDVYIEVRVYN